MHLDRFLRCHFSFVDNGRQITQCRVQSFTVVEADDVIIDIVFSLGVVRILALPDAFHLEIQEEALGDGIIPAISLSAHGANKAMFIEQALVKLAGI